MIGVRILGLRGIILVLGGLRHGNGLPPQNLDGALTSKVALKGVIRMVAIVPKLLGQMVKMRKMDCMDPHHRPSTPTRSRRRNEILQIRNWAIAVLLADGVGIFGWSFLRFGIQKNHPLKLLCFHPKREAGIFSFLFFSSL
jgi:hypothetical protein